MGPGTAAHSRAIIPVFAQSNQNMQHTQQERGTLCRFAIITGRSATIFHKAPARTIARVTVTIPHVRFIILHTIFLKH